MVAKQELRINYDDPQDGVVEKINKILRETYGVEFQDDNLEHDGFMLYRLRPMFKSWKNT